MTEFRRTGDRERVSAGTALSPCRAARATLVLALAAALPIPLLAQDEGAERVEGLVVEMSISKDVYETNELLRGELLLVNSSDEWVDLPNAASLSESLVLVDAEGNEFEPQDPKRFAPPKRTRSAPRDSSDSRSTSGCCSRTSRNREAIS